MPMGVISGPRIASAGRIAWVPIIIVFVVILMVIFFLMGFTASIENAIFLMLGVLAFSGVFLPIPWKWRLVFPIIGIGLILFGLAM
jgi:hypothetical protein